MNLKEIRELIDLITEKGISEFELERSGVRLKISRNPGAHAPHVVLPPSDSRPAAAIPPGAVPQPPAGLPSPPVESAKPAPAPGEELEVVRSPIVGTFYEAPTQGAEPFVRVGDRVQPGQVLCIIEAMKLMNELEAEIAGEIVKCYVENGQPVEYGEPLFDIRPAPGAKKRA